MKICYFGTYDLNRPRNRILINGLRENGIEVIECHFSLWAEVEDKTQMGLWPKISTCLRFLFCYPLLIAKYFAIEEHDAIIVGYFGHFDMLVAKALSVIRKKPLFFNAFISLYDTIVFDRRLIKPRSLLSRFFYHLDKLSCQLADGVFLDTEAYINYFVETFELRREKFKRIFVGADESNFYPTETPKTDQATFNVLFYGRFIPLQGVEYIINAAKVLEGQGVNFTIIGKGQDHLRARRAHDELGVRNIKWIDWADYRDLCKHINSSDVCLGIFGDTGKAKRVIPNKAFQVIASGRPLLTGDSPAAKELFVDAENAILCQMANPRSMAESILLLKSNAGLRERIALKGHECFKEKCSTKIIGLEALTFIKDFCRV